MRKSWLALYFYNLTHSYGFRKLSTVTDVDEHMSGSEHATRDNALIALTADAETVLAALNRFPEIVERYLRLSGIPQTTFSVASGGGVDFVRHMRSKRDLRSSTLVRVLQHIALAGMTV